MADVTQEEFEARVGVLEREVEGEKMVTRHVLEQTRRNGDDLAAVKTRLDRVERKVDGLDNKIDRLDNKIDGVDHKIDSVESRINNRIGSLERSLPTIVGEVVREAFREERERKR